MTRARHPATLRLAATLALALLRLPLAPAAALAQTSPSPIPQPSTINRNTIVLDASHGGIDSGSRIGDNILEKDITLALAFKLRSLLTARGFSVIMTRDSDAALLPHGSKPLTLDDRAGLANTPRAAACLLLHATGAGTGVHLYTSDIAPAPLEVALLPWLTAQAAWAPQSHLLAQQLANALQRASIAFVNNTAAVRPVDSLTCPAVIVELAPEGDEAQSINDADYQQRVAQAIAGALVFWPKQVQPPLKMMSPPPSAPKPTAPDDAVPALKSVTPTEVHP